MARARRELEGEIAAVIVGLIPAAVWAPGELLKLGDLNPFRERDEMSEAMRKHLEGWERDKWRAMVRSNHAGG